MGARGRSTDRAGISRPAGARGRPDDARLRAVIAPVVATAGYDLEDLIVSRAGRRHLVRVLVDGDGGISLDDIADVSRAVSAALDSAEETGGELIAGEYQLEVGSPGVDRPLTSPRHWRRNVGRLVQVRARDRQLAGRIVGADDDGIVLDAAGTAQELSYDELGPGRVQIEFSRLAAAGGPEMADDDLAGDEDGDDEELEDEER